MKFQLKLIERRDLRLNTFAAKGLISKLDLATRLTAFMHRMDLIVAYRLLCHILNHESTQSGLNLTHTQDRNFIQVNSLFTDLFHKGTNSEQQSDIYFLMMLLLLFFFKEKIILI